MQKFKLRTIVALSVAGTLGVSQSAVAQERKVERIEVTGSNIKRIDAEGPAPILIITKEEIERHGAGTVAEVLRSMPINNFGQFSETTLGGNSFAPGTSAVSLRGLGANTTLVLLNGRRMANYGFGQNITVSFVDLNSIPIGAIERIEVLKDGASAIYGSDAIAGVVNIILRKDYKGVELSASYGEASAGDSAQQRYGLTAGWGDPAKDRFNVMAVLDYFKRDATMARDRDFSRNADQRARGGFDLRSPAGSPGTWLTAGRGGFADNTVFPTCPAESIGLFSGQTTCYFNFQVFIPLIPPTERQSAFLRGSYEFSPAISAFAEFGYNKNETEGTSAPTPAQQNLPVGHNSNPYPFVVPIRYRFLDVGPRLDNLVTETTRVVAGVKGFGAGWDWEAAYSSAESDSANRRRNFVSQPALSTLVSNGIYNFVNPSANSAALVDSLRASPFRLAVSTVKAFDAKASRELMQLPAGPVGVALGFESRKEKVSDQLDPLSVQGLIVGSGGATASGDRKQKSLFGELSIPVLKNLEAQIAVRHEDYSDFGRATKPKVALAWKATPDLLVRASYSEGFRAPSLQELYLGQATSFPSFIDTPRCNSYTAAFGANDARTLAVCSSAQVRTISQGNSALQPEESESSNIGIVWEIIPGLSMSADYYNINHTNRILQPSVTFQLLNEASFPGTVNRFAPSATDVLANSPGQLQGVGSDPNVGLIRKYQNLTRQETNGVDLDLRYRFKVGALGVVTLSSLTSHILTFRNTAVPGNPLVERAGTYEFPRTTTTNSVNVNNGPWSYGLTLRTRSMFQQNNQRVLTHVASFTTADAQVQYVGFKGLKLVFGVNNLENKAPPFSDNENDGYANSTDNPVGRYFYGRVTYTFK
ncbi:MAG: TonB-dependent receptor [Burkholderiales bacterium]|nr:TonB-dependent receptor [Burkholderiales bacterium]